MFCWIFRERYGDGMLWCVYVDNGLEKVAGLNITDYHYLRNCVGMNFTDYHYLRNLAGMNFTESL